VTDVVEKLLWAVEIYGWVFAGRRERFLSFHYVVMVVRGFREMVDVENISRGSLTCASDKPLKDCIQVRLLSRTDTVAAHLAMGNAFQIQGLDQLVHGQFILEIRFVAKDQEWDSVQDGFLQEQMEFIFSYRKSIRVC
jgi:hypothetical protein